MDIVQTGVTHLCYMAKLVTHTLGNPGRPVDVLDEL